ncbi:MAG: hypothetical protein MUO53_05005 [Maribacter sp.]|nr:hypothetical protein [Maribacter sp.]
MRVTIIIGCILLFAGCNTKVTEEELPLLNGYWEIARVNFPDGSLKEYNVNSSIDYIHLDGRKGYRKKVQPKFDGTFVTSNDAEMFVIGKKNEMYQVTYSTGFSTWKEDIISLSASKFSVKNEEGITYTYKRFKAINVQK